jgi:hypothetical protein
MHPPVIAPRCDHDQANQCCSGIDRTSLSSLLASFGGLLTCSSDCRQDLTRHQRDTRMRWRSVFGSLPARDRATGCRPRSLGFLFARTVMQVRVKKEDAARTPLEDVDST